ncbi:hypothetical protein [Lusitaniella coriacea]|uniref:hypothetical protein n=1 Tax=Lusitaniella coriacea TaxID=1983105 RepID=UPI001D13EDB3|nr:hypothetical protein [Lusitaniella coriacea]
MLSTTRNFRTILKNVKDTVPDYFFYYCSIYIILQFVLFVFFVPGNDFDSMALYIPTLKIQEFGVLKQVATIDMQYLFPLFFYQLHKPLFEFGYFTTLPNFLLFLSFIYLLFRFHRKELYPFFLIGIFSCQLLLVQSTALKHDITVGILTFIGWFVANRLKNKTWYITACGLVLFSLVGVKWHGVLPGLLLGILMLFIAIKEKLFSKASIFAFLGCSPLFWLVSDANSYLNNYFDYGKFMPTIPSIGSSMSVNLTLPNILENIHIFISANFFDTFNGILFILDGIFGTHILDAIARLTSNLAITDTIRVTWPSPIYTSFGISILILIGCNLYVILNQNFSFYLKSAALISIAYIGAILLLFNYSMLFNRYCLPTFILGIVPAAEVASRLFSHLKQNHATWLKRTLIGYAIIVSLHALILIQDKPLIDLTAQGGVRLESIWHHARDRDTLYCYSWRGYIEVYHYFRENILPSDSLLFVNNSQELVFTYPFLKDRNPANTLTGSPHNPGGYKQHLGKFDYVMLYRGVVEDERYERIYTYPGRFEMNIYKLKS